MKENSKKRNILKAVGLAVGLPSSMLGVFSFAYYLVSKSIISMELALVIFLSIIFYTFYMMIRYANKK